MNARQAKAVTQAKARVELKIIKKELTKIKRSRLAVAVLPQQLIKETRLPLRNASVTLSAAHEELSFLKAVLANVSVWQRLAAARADVRAYNEFRSRPPLTGIEYGQQALARELAKRKAKRDEAENQLIMAPDVLDDGSIDWG